MSAITSTISRIWSNKGARGLYPCLRRALGLTGETPVAAPADAEPGPTPESVQRRRFRRTVYTVAMLFGAMGMLLGR